MGFAVRTPGNIPSPTAGTRQHISSRSTQPATRCEFGVDLVTFVSTLFQKVRRRAGWCAHTICRENKGTGNSDRLSQLSLRN